jgi:CHAT domain-containing protein
MRAILGRRSDAFLSLAVCGALAACTPEKPVASVTVQAVVQETGFVPPPRTLEDILARLEAELSRRDAAARTREDAAPGASETAAAAGGGASGDVPPDAAPQDGPARRAAEARRRSFSASSGGRLDEALEASRLALRIAREARLPDLARHVVRQAELEWTVEDLRASGRLHAEASTLFERSRGADGRPDQLFRAMTSAGLSAIAASRLGDRSGADTMLERMRAIRARAQPGPYAAEWDGWILRTEAELFGSRRRNVDAEAKWRAAIEAWQSMETRRRAGLRVADRTIFRDHLIFARSQLARLLEAQWRYAEAEVQIRQALAESLDLRGVFSTSVLWRGRDLASLLISQGRYAEAGRLTAALLRLGALQGLPSRNATILDLQRLLLASSFYRGLHAQTVEGFEGFARRLVAEGAGDAADAFLANGNYAVALVATGRASEAVRILDASIANRTRRNGADDFRARVTQAQRGVARGRLGDVAGALADLDAAREAIRRGPPGDAAAGESLAGWAQVHRRFAIEGMIDLLATLPPGAAPGRDLVSETFELADVARSLSVQGAVDALAQRAAVRDPALAELIRREQDALQESAALQGALANLVAVPASQRDAAATREITARVAALRDEMGALGQRIRSAFPDFDALRRPGDASIARARQALAPEEALLSFHVGRDAVQVWALRRDGPVRHARVAMGEAELARSVATLRRALDPNASTIEQIPEFDVVLARRLHAVLVEPVADAIGDASTLVVVPHGPLAQLPLGVLVTGERGAGDVAGGEVRFAAYARVPWLARRHAIVQVPAVSSMIALRAMPPAASGRLPFAGFGDAWFSPEHAADARLTTVPEGLQARGVRLARRSAPTSAELASAGIASLARLPDTAEEIRAVARALGADPSSVFIGAAATERQVRRMDLSNRRVVMFATHGLVPGDLDGLHQPALALTPREVAGQEAGDGLLTMGDILTMRLDADWVVLSACNTAAGDGGGAEAMSGLGRAFFYAGARALLVTFWPVETASARSLTTDVFARQAADRSLSRARALQQAMLALVDGPGAVDPGSGASLFSYAHPLFWAPFALVGDGGR